MNRLYCVYMHKNLVNDKCYVGITCQKPENRWGPNGNGYKTQTKFYNAILCYGWDNFTHTIIATELSKDQAYQLEQEYIKKLDSITNGYNITVGGDSARVYLNEVEVKEAELQRSAKYRASHKKEISERNHIRYLQNKEEYSMKSAQYQKEHHAEYLQWRALRREQIKELRKALRELATLSPDKFSEEELAKLKRLDTCSSLPWLKQLFARVSEKI